MHWCSLQWIGEIGHCKPIMFSHHDKELLFVFEEIMNVIQGPLHIHNPPDFVRPAKLSCYSEALHACQPTWRIRPLNVANTGSFFKQTEGTGDDPVPIDLFPLHRPVRRSEAHHTSTAGGRQTMALCPAGGSRASLCLYCSTALGNLRTLDQTKAKMNSNVEDLKNQFSLFFRFFRKESYCVF